MAENMKLIISILMLIIASSYVAAQEIPVAKSGETVKAMAVRLGLDPVEFARFNKLSQKTLLKEGRRLEMWCDLPLEKAPVIRGMRLGMTETEAERLLGDGIPFSQEKATRNAFILPRNNPSFDGIRSIQLNTFDAKAYRVEIHYDDSVKWSNIAEFVNNFGPKLGMPAAWKQAHADGAAKIKCRDFDVDMWISGLGEGIIVMTDILAIPRIAVANTKLTTDQKTNVKP